MVRLLPLLLATVLALPAAADEVVVFRCEDADGALSLQDEPCPQGQQQRELRYVPPEPADPAEATAAEAPAEAPAAPGLARVPEPAHVAPARPIGALGSTEIPSIFRCVSFDGDDYLSESGDGRRRCVPVAVTRGMAAAPVGPGTCEWVADECRVLSGEEACSAWDQVRRDTVRAEREAFSDTLDEIRRDLARVESIQALACPG